MKKREEIWFNGFIKGTAFGVVLFLIILLLSSCTKPELDKSFYFSAAYPPYSCTDLEPYEVVIKIDGTTYSLLAKEVPGGLITEEMTMLQGRYIVEDVKVYNKEGKMTHEVAKEFDAAGWVVVRTPFPIEVNGRFDWISGQLFCDKN